MDKSIVNIHASCVRLERAGAAFGAPRDAGVMLIGKSGAGKSDLALRLIALGAKLVSDDRTELFVEAGRLFARAPKTIRGLIEVRGLGIVALPAAARARVALVADLSGTKARLPPREWYKSPLALPDPVPLIRLAPFEASAPARIALAAAALGKDLFRDRANRK